MTGKTAQKSGPAPAIKGNPLARMNAQDKEFLPAALEILETPPSPVKLWIGGAISAFMAGAIAWSFVGHIDVYARAHGRLVTETRPSVVQALVAGKVKAIAVENGSHVSAGQIVAALDPAEAEADVVANGQVFNSSSAEVLYRQLAVSAAAGTKTLTGESADDYASLTNQALSAPDLPAEQVARAQGNLTSDLAQLRSGLVNLDQQIAQSEASRHKSEASIKADQSIIEALQARLDVQNQALEKQVASKLALLEAKEALARGQAQLVTDQGQRDEALAAMAQLEGQKVKLIDGFINDNQAKITEALRKADDAREQLAKAKARLQQMTLVAPISGTVEGLTLVSVGQVLTTGQQAMTLTPDDQKLGAQVYISNGDFGFVQEGQEATLKFDAYPFTEYGTVKGKVERIASDALTEQDAERLQSKPTSLGNTGSYSPAPSAPGQGENLVFPVTITMPDQSLEFRGRSLPLKPGMTIEVEIKTDSRRLIDYLLSPIRKITNESLHER